MATLWHNPVDYLDKGKNKWGQAVRPPNLPTDRERTVAVYKHNKARWRAHLVLK